MIVRSATQLHPLSKNSTANSKQRLPTSKYDILETPNMILKGLF